MPRPSTTGPIPGLRTEVAELEERQHWPKGQKDLADQEGNHKEAKDHRLTDQSLEGGTDLGQIGGWWLGPIGSGGAVQTSKSTRRRHVLLQMVSGNRGGFNIGQNVHVLKVENLNHLNKMAELSFSSRNNNIQNCTYTLKVFSTFIFFMAISRFSAIFEALWDCVANRRNTDGARAMEGEERLESDECTSRHTKVAEWGWGRLRTPRPLPPGEVNRGQPPPLLLPDDQHPFLPFFLSPFILLLFRHPSRERLLPSPSSSSLISPSLYL